MQDNINSKNIAIRLLDNWKTADKPSIIPSQANSTIPVVSQTYASDIEVARIYSVSRATIWRWTSQCDFPKPIKLSPGCTRWKLSEIELWENSRGSIA